MANTCQSCQSYVVDGECHRYPPTIVEVGSNIRAMWPSVTPDDWCNEWAVSTGGGSGLELTSISPNSLPAGSAPTTVDLYGAGFDSTCTINVEGSSRATFFIDTTHLQYTARPDLQTTPVTVQVSVSNSQAETSNTLPFSFT